MLLRRVFSFGKVLRISGNLLRKDTMRQQNNQPNLGEAEGTRGKDLGILVDVKDEELLRAEEGAVLLLIEGIYALKNPRQNARRALCQICGADSHTWDRAVNGVTFIGQARWSRILHALPWVGPVYFYWESIQFSGAKSNDPNSPKKTTSLGEQKHPYGV